MDAARYGYSLAVYREEAGLGDGGAALRDDEILEVLKIEPGSLLHAALGAAKTEGEEKPSMHACAHALHGHVGTGVRLVCVP